MRCLLQWTINFAATVPALLCSAGCEAFAYSYDYRGTLVNPDGHPAAGVRVSAQPSARHFYHYDKVGSGGQWVDMLDDWSTTTDQSGQFTGRVNGDYQYTRLLCLPVSPAAKLPGMYLWVFQRSEWSPIFVPLDEASQKKGYSGGRHVDLPAVTLPSAATRPAQATRRPVVRALRAAADRCPERGAVPAVAK